MRGIPDRVIFISAIIWYIITAYFSVGYFHGDEHYQIIEFSGLKTGTNKPIDMAWEYKAQVRSSVQPVLCYFIFKVCDKLLITDPYIKSFILRLITGVLAAFIIYWLAKTVRRFIDDKYWKPLLIFSFFTWFLPFINVRFSSETWSGLCLLISIILALKENKPIYVYILIGFAIGLTFLFRPQTTMASIGIVLWLIFSKKEKFGKILIIFWTACFVLIIGLLSDYWFYGNWVFTPWNYFKVNIIDGVANNFGVSPWYIYLFDIFRYPFFPIGIVLLLSLLLFVYKQPRNLLTWVIIPFIVVHSLISHKELRFIFPIANLAPAIFFMVISQIKLTHINRIFLVTIVIILLLVNSVGIFVEGFTPADTGRIALTKAIHLKYKNRKINLISCPNSNPYTPGNNLVAMFYKEPDIQFTHTENDEELNRNDIEDNAVNLFVIKKKFLKNIEARDIIEKNGFKYVKEGIDPFYQPILKIYGFNVDEILVLYSNKY